MNRVTLTPRAKADLNGIWDFTVSCWGLAQAEKYIRDLWSCMEKQGNGPANAIDIDEVRQGYKKARAGSHVIFFKQTSCGIDVVRILHQTMDFNRHLK